MQVSVESIEGLGRRMTVTVPGSTLESAVDKRLKEISRTARINGFRPGKIPMNVVRRMYGVQARHEVIDDVVRDSFGKAIDENNLQLAGAPSISFVPSDEEGEAAQTLRYQAEFEILPDFNLIDLTQLELKRPEVVISDEDVQDVLQTLQRQHTEWKPVERAAAEGDRVKINFEGRLDGEPFDGGKGDDVPVVLGEGSMIESFEQGLYGLQPDEKRDIDVQFPDDYPAEHLAGRVANFSIEAVEVAEAELPAVDDAFAARFDLEPATVETLHEQLRSNMERELQDAVFTIMKRQVIEGLTDQHQFGLPDVMVGQELKALSSQKNQDGETETVDESKRPEAERRVRLGLVMAKLVSENQITPSKERMQQKLQQLMASSPGIDPQQMMQYIGSNEQMIENLRTAALEDEVVDFICQKVECQAHPASFKTTINASRSGASLPSSED